LLDVLYGREPEAFMALLDASMRVHVQVELAAAGWRAMDTPMWVDEVVNGGTGMERLPPVPLGETAAGEMLANALRSSADVFNKTVPRGVGNNVRVRTLMCCKTLLSTAVRIVPALHVPCPTETMLRVAYHVQPPAAAVLRKRLGDAWPRYACYVQHAVLRDFDEPTLEYAYPPAPPAALHTLTPATADDEHNVLPGRLFHRWSEPALHVLNLGAATRDTGVPAPLHHLRALCDREADLLRCVSALCADRPVEWLACARGVATLQQCVLHAGAAPMPPSQRVLLNLFEHALVAVRRCQALLNHLTATPGF
jgi:hypothetical protein